MLADRISNRLVKAERRYSADTWLSDYLLPAMSFGYNGSQYPYGLNMTSAGQHVTEWSNSLPGYSAAVRSSPPAFAAQMVRALVLSQARFTFRQRPSFSSSKKVFGTRDLGVLERPWPNATTGELISRMEWHAGLAGNSYVTNRTRGRLRVLRPDWVALVYGSQQEPEDAAYALDGELIGYAYANGGIVATGSGEVTGLANRVQTLLPEEVAAWSPIPDELGAGIGQSWITPAIRDIQSDNVSTQHKIQFFKNAGTPNLVVKGIPATTKAQFDELVAMMEERHAGIANAFRTLYLTAGADATVVGSNFRDMDLKAIQGASETRISSLSRVPASLLGISEGLAGSSLNAGNFAAAKRTFADTWVYPTLQDLAAALAPMVNVPRDAELWFDTADIPLLREDGKDAAEINQIRASTITTLVREGYTPESAQAFSVNGDASLLKHTNLVSVQLRPPGAPENVGDDVAAPALNTARPAIRTRATVGERKFNPAQPRDPGGQGGGQWIGDPSAILRKLFKIGGNEVAVTAHDDGSRTLDFGGGRRVRLEPHEFSGPYKQRNNLRGLAFHVVDMEPGEGEAVTRIVEAPDGRSVRSELLIGVKKVANEPDIHPNGDPDEETWDLTPVSLHLPPNDDPSFQELMDSPPVATMRQRDLVTLAETPLDLSANGVETGNGRVDIFRDGGKFVIRPAGGDAVTLDRKGVMALYSAINELWDDDGRDTRPSGEAVEKVARTKAGDFKVRMTGEGVRTEITGPGLALTVNEAYLLDFVSAISEMFESRSAAGDGEERAVGNQLKHYWTKGEGLAKWRFHPHPWTRLRNLLREHVGPGRAERIASEWFHDVFGYWPGHRKGKNPVGPG